MSLNSCILYTRQKETKRHKPLHQKIITLVILIITFYAFETKNISKYNKIES